MSEIPLTLSRFILRQQGASSGATDELARLLVQVGLVGKILSQDLRRAALIGVLGATGGTNVQGEVVKKLDELANETFLRVFRQEGLVCALASEEMDHALALPDHQRSGRYLLLFDPLDGSSNTDVNMPLGTIFSVLRWQDSARLPSDEAFFRKGTEQVAAGYVLYGPSTMMVYTTGQGVSGFTLDPGMGEYLLSHQHIRIPARGTIYAANEGNYHKWTAGAKRYIDGVKVKDKATGRPYSGRYSGCLVADVHRMLLAGGIYFYPGEVDKPEGKLRLLYEANPLGWVVEQAGGKASTGTMRILDVEPKKLHQRVPLIIGSRDDVSEAEAAVQGGG